MLVQRIKHFLSTHLSRWTQYLFFAGRLRKVKEAFDRSDKRCIYHIHIRKTGGTSLNHAFISAMTSEESDSVEERMRRTPFNKIVSEGRVFAAWSKRAINSNQFHFGYSHVPMDELNLPEDAFTFVCFRDPIQRLYSHYKMLVGYHKNNVFKPCMLTEGDWATGSYIEFLERASKRAIENQIYMFSKDYDIEEALRKVAKVDEVLFFSQLSESVRRLSKSSGLDLTLPHKNKSMSDLTMTDNEMEYVQSLLEREYEFINEVKRMRGIPY